MHSILQKVAMCGTSYMSTLLDDFLLENIPECIGGKFRLFNEPFPFDLSESGPLHYPGAPTDFQSENKPNSPNAVALLFLEADAGLTSATLDSLLAPPTMQRTTSGGSAVDGPEKRSRSSSGSAPLERVPQSRRPTLAVNSEQWTTRAWKHTATWVRTQPVKVLLTVLWAAVFVWIRIAGWLQPLVYPAIVYATLFDTTPIVRLLLSHFDIEYKLHSGRSAL